MLTWDLRVDLNQNLKQKRGASFLIITPNNFSWETFHLWFQKPFPTKLSSPVIWQPLTADTGCNICLKKERSGNKSVSQIFKISFHSALIVWLAIFCMFFHVNELLKAMKRRWWVILIRWDCIINVNFKDILFEKKMSCGCWDIETSVEMVIFWENFFISLWKLCRKKMKWTDSLIITYFCDTYFYKE